MKIKALSKKNSWSLPEQETLKAEYAQGKKAGEIRLGDNFLFYRPFLWIKCIPLNEIANLYLKVEFGESGDVPVHEHYIRVKTKQGEEFTLRLDRADDAKRVLSLLENNSFGIELKKWD